MVTGPGPLRRGPPGDSMHSGPVDRSTLGVGVRRVKVPPRRADRLRTLVEEDLPPAREFECGDRQGVGGELAL